MDVARLGLIGLESWTQRGSDVGRNSKGSEGKLHQHMGMLSRCRRGFSFCMQSASCIWLLADHPHGLAQVACDSVSQVGLCTWLTSCTSCNQTAKESLPQWNVTTTAVASRKLPVTLSVKFAFASGSLAVAHAIRQPSKDHNFYSLNLCKTQGFFGGMALPQCSVTSAYVRQDPVLSQLSYM